MKKALVLLLALLFVFSTFSAMADTDIWAKYDEPTVITIGRSGTSMAYALEGDTFEDNAYLRWIKDTYNIEVQYAFAPLTEYEARVSLAISSGELPDLMYITNQTQLDMMLTSGMIADLTDVIKEYASPLVNDLIDSYGGFDAAFEKTTVDGRVYALRSFSPGYQYQLLWVRSDWLEAVGMEAPANWDDVEAIAAAFVEKKLGGEGTTVGIEISNAIAGSYNSVGSADPVFNYFGSYPRHWIEGEDGKLVYSSVQPEAKEALAMLADWYQKGLIDPEFATKDINASISAGYCGIVFGPWWGTTQMKNAIANHEGAVWQSYPCILNEEGVYNVMSPNQEYSWAVVRADYEHPEIAVKLMNITADVCTLAREPISEYETVRPLELIAIDTNPASKWSLWPYPCETQMNNAQYLLSNAIVNAVDNNVTDGFPEANLAELGMMRDYIDGKNTSADAWNSWARYTGRKQMVAVNDVLHIEQCYYPMTTETMSYMWDNLETMEANTYKKIIMGEQPLSDFDKFVEDWYAQGGSDIVDEVNQQFGR